MPHTYKWDETSINGALDTIMKLNPQVYNKYTEYSKVN